MTLCSLVEICRCFKGTSASSSSVEEYHANSIAPSSAVLAPSAVTRTFWDGFCKILYPAEGDDTFLQNICKYLSDGTQLHPTRHCSSQSYHSLSRSEPFVMWVVLENQNVFSSQGQGNILKRSHYLCGVLSHDMSFNTKFLSRLVLQVPDATCDLQFASLWFKMFLKHQAVWSVSVLIILFKFKEWFVEMWCCRSLTLSSVHSRNQKSVCTCANNSGFLFQNYRYVIISHLWCV